MNSVRYLSIGLLQLIGVGGVVVCGAQTSSIGESSAGSPVVVSIAAETSVGSGEYPALMEADPSLATHTIYRPADLEALREKKMPLVVWGNGACLNTGNSFRWFLSEIASYGFLVIATGPIGPESVERSPLPDYRRPMAMRPVSQLPPAPTHSAQLIDAINWALAKNNEIGSQYYQRIAVSQIAVMGQSCGGVQAIEASRDPRVTTTVVWNSGLLPEPTVMAGGKTMSKDDLKMLHAPTAYISGDSEDIAFANANTDFEGINRIPVVRAYESGVPHAGTYREPGGGEFGGVAVAWLQWQLQHDDRAKKMFTGRDCGLCVNPRWVVRTKNIQ